MYDDVLDTKVSNYADDTKLSTIVSSLTDQKNPHSNKELFEWSDHNMMKFDNDKVF